MIARELAEATSGSRQVYVADEYSPIDIPITEVVAQGRLHVYPEVVSRGYFSVDLRDDHLILRAGGYVGLIPINDRLTIDVRPRAPIGNLERMLTVAETGTIRLHPHQRLYLPHENQPYPVLDAMTDALIEAVEEIVAKGLHHEYRERSEDTSFPRGRVLLTETMRRHDARSRFHSATVSLFDRTADTPLNRCIRFALWYVVQRYLRMRPVRTGVVRRLKRLNRLFVSFEGIELDFRRSWLQDTLVRDAAQIPAGRAYYRRALAIAKALIRDQGVTFDGRGDDILMASLLVDMNLVFETYIRIVLIERLSDSRDDVEAVDGNRAGPAGGRKPLFDEGPPQDATPDIVVRKIRAPASFPTLLDAKYKVFRGGPDREDINQAVTYAVSYRAPSVVLVYPATVGGQSGLHAIGRVGNVRLWVYVFDLAGDLETEEALFSEGIAALS